jgi:ferric-dicitrate binding protein FerR (iron transport regulator)
MSNRDPWLSQPTNEVEAHLAAGLEEARNRLPDEVTLRRLWSKVASPELERPARSRWPWFVGGVVTSSALAVALGIWLMPMRQTPIHFIIGSNVLPAQMGEKTGEASEAARLAPEAKVAAAATEGSIVEIPGDNDDDPKAPEPPLVAAPMPSTKAPTMLRTLLGQHRRYRLRGGTVARLSPSSVVSVVAQNDASDRPTVEKGTVAFAVPHQAPGHNFSVTAGPYRVVVIGTKFRLHVETSHVAVSVDEGVVEVWKKHRLVRLASGDSWSSITERGGLAAEGAVNGPAEPQVAPPAPAPVAPPAPAPAPAPQPPQAAAPAPASQPAPAPVVDPLREAHAALAAGDAYRALDAYHAVIARGGTPAENAAYEMAGVIRDRLRQPGEAIAAWKRYRTQHPNGLLRAEADVSIIETLVTLGDTASALGEANDFLKRHLDNERRAEIARVAGDLYRERGDCEHAVAAYQIALAASRTGEITQYATFHRAACLVTMGDSSGTAALSEYLHTWPKGRFSREATRLLQTTSTATKTP